VVFANAHLHSHTQRNGSVICYSRVPSLISIITVSSEC